MANFYKITVGVDGLAQVEKADRALQSLDKSAENAVKSTGRLSRLPIDTSASTRAVGNLDGAMSGLRSSLAGIGTAFAASGIIRGLAAIGQQSALSARALSFATKDYNEHAAALQVVGRAQRTLGLSSLVAEQGFAGFYNSLRPVGIGLSEIETAFVGFNKIVLKGGADATQAAGAMVQLRQAFASGKLSGDEFASLRDVPGFLQAIAGATGKPIGALGDMAAKGQITSDVLLKAFKNAADGAIPPQLAFQRLSTLWADFQRTLADSLGRVIGPLVDQLARLAENISKLPKPVTDAGIAVASIGVAGLAAATALGAIGLAAPVAATGFASVAAAATAAWAAITAPAGLAVLALAAVVAAAAALSPEFRRFLSEIPARLLAAWADIQRQAEAAFERITQAWRDLRSTVGAGVSWVRARFSELWANLPGPARNALEAIGSAVGGLQSAFAGFLDWIGPAWNNVMGQLAAATINSLNPLLGLLKAAGIDVGSAVVSAFSGAGPSGLTLRSSNSDYPAAAGGGTPPQVGDMVGGDSGKAKKAPSFKLGSRAQAAVNAAAKLGVSPLDLLQIISVETGGTFAPSEPGRGAAAGRIGLIQFGANERQQYGASAGQSFEEQIQGPVVRYLQDRFGKVGRSTQGASLLDLYTAVNQGSPLASLYDSKDGNKITPRSLLPRIQGTRNAVLDKFFGGSIANVPGADGATAGANRAQGFEEQRRLEDKNAADLTASERRASLAEQNLNILKEQSPLMRLNLEFARDEFELGEQLADLNRGITDEGARQNNQKAYLLELDQRRLQLLKDQDDLVGQTLAKAGQAASAGINAAGAGLGAAAQKATSSRAGRAAAELRTLTDPLDFMERNIVAISDGFGKLFQDIASGSATAGQAFASFARSIGDSLLQQFSRILASKLAVTLLGLLGGGGGGGFASVFGGGGGGFASGFGLPGLIPGRAKGGPVFGSRPYVIGEQGPELMIPGASGTVVPNDIFAATKAALANGQGAPGDSGGEADAFGPTRASLSQAAAALASNAGGFAATQAAVNSSTERIREQKYNEMRMQVLTGQLDPVNVKLEAFDPAGAGLATLTQVDQVARSTANNVQAQMLRKMRTDPAFRRKQGI